MCSVIESKTENGDGSQQARSQEVNGEEEVRASSKAANLFAALAAEALEDEEVEMLPAEPAVPQPEVCYWK